MTTRAEFVAEYSRGLAELKQLALDMRNPLQAKLHGTLYNLLHDADELYRSNKPTALVDKCALAEQAVDIARTQVAAIQYMLEQGAGLSAAERDAEINIMLTSDALLLKVLKKPYSQSRVAAFYDYAQTLVEGDANPTAATGL